MSDCNHMCTKCDRKSCIEFKPKMAIPRELQTDYETMITANLLMAVSIESLKCKNDQLQAENAELRWLVRDMFEEIEDAGFDPYVERQGKRGPYYEEDPSWRVKIRERVRELGIEED